MERFFKNHARYNACYNGPVELCKNRGVRGKGMIITQCVTKHLSGVSCLYWCARCFFHAALFCIVVAGCADLSGNPPPAGPSRAAEVLDAQQVIALIPAARDVRTLKAGAAALEFRLLEDTTLNGLGLRMLRFDVPPPLDGKGAIAKLEAFDASATAGVNHIYRTAAEGDQSRFDYASDLMNWPAGGCRAQGPIGMLDTGVSESVAQTSGGTVISRSFVNGSQGITRHGSDVASVLMDPRRVSSATLYNAAVIQRTADGQQIAGVDSILKALDWLAEEGVRVVNISLAGPYNKLLDKGVGEAVRDGMVIVAAVGNDGGTAPPRYPAALDNVIAVTAVDANRRIYRNAVRGGHVDIAAPGVDIPVALNNQTRFVTGTSMAVPFVTARIATDPALHGRTAPEIRAALAQSAEDLGSPGADNVFGSGLMRALPSCNR